MKNAILDSLRIMFLLGVHKRLLESSIRTGELTVDYSVRCLADISLGRTESSPLLSSDFELSGQSTEKTRKGYMSLCTAYAA